MEAAIAGHPRVTVGEVMAFAAPHKELEEVVGIALPRTSGVGLRQMRAWASKSLEPSLLPQVTCCTMDWVAQLARCRCYEWLLLDLTRPTTARRPPTSPLPFTAGPRSGRYVTTHRGHGKVAARRLRGEDRVAHRLRDRPHHFVARGGWVVATAC